MGRKKKKKNRSRKGPQNRSNHPQQTLDPMVVSSGGSLDPSAPSQAETNIEKDVAGLDFSNWSLDSDALDVSTNDEVVPGVTIDFSQWSLGGDVAGGGDQSTRSLTTDVSQWSLESSASSPDSMEGSAQPEPQAGIQSSELAEQEEQLSAEEWVVLGEEAFGQNDLDDAEKCFLTALLLNPISPITLSNLGVVYHTRGNLEAAEVCYLKSVAFDQKSADGFYGLAQMWSDAGHTGLALRYAARGLRRQPDHESLANIAQDLSRHLDGHLAQLPT